MSCDVTAGLENPEHTPPTPPQKKRRGEGKGMHYYMRFFSIKTFLSACTARAALLVGFCHSGTSGSATPLSAQQFSEADNSKSTIFVRARSYKAPLA